MQKSISRLRYDILDIKDVIVQRLQDDNLKLKERVSCLEDKVIQLEIKNNSLEQYGRTNDLEIEGIPTSISDKELEKTAVALLNSINVNLDSSDVEDCHRIGRSKDGKPKKTITRTVNRKFCKKALLNRKKLSSITINNNVIQLKNKVFIGENLTNYNNKIAFHCRKLNKASLVEKCYSRDGVVHIVTKDGWRDKATKVLHMNQLLELFPEFIFSDSRNSTGDAVFDAPWLKKLMERLQNYFLFFCYSDVYLRSSVTHYYVVFLFASLQGQVDKQESNCSIL